MVDRHNVHVQMIGPNNISSISASNPRALIASRVPRKPPKKQKGGGREGFRQLLKNLPGYQSGY